MIGTYDFCAHYEWTFAWLEAAGGEQLLQEYWTDAIGEDSQRHAAELIQGQGFEGMMKYWGHTLAEESPEKGYHMTQSPSMVRCDMHDCPSKGFLIKNNLQQYKDYCDHCTNCCGRNCLCYRYQKFNQYRCFTYHCWKNKGCNKANN